MSLHGHGNCVTFVKSFNIPTLVLGGGGYTVRNVARCWSYETSLLLNLSISNSIPPNEYIGSFAPTYALHLIPNADMENKNSTEKLEAKKNMILENIRILEAAPSVQLNYVPPDWKTREEEKEDDPDVRNVDSIYLYIYIFI